MTSTGGVAHNNNSRKGLAVYSSRLAHARRIATGTMYAGVGLTSGADVSKQLKDAWESSGGRPRRAKHKNVT